MTSLAALRLRPYRRLLFAYTVNAAGDWLGEIALSVLVFDATRSVLAVSALWILGRFVPAFLAPLALCKIERAGLGPTSLYGAQAALAAGLVAGIAAGLPVAGVLVLATIDGVLSLNARALTKTAVVATTRPAGLLREGNALLAMAFTLSATVGPVLAGVTVAAFGAPYALALDAISFALAASCLIGADLPARTTPPEDGAFASARAGARAVLSSTFLRRLFYAEGAVSVLLAAVIPVELVFVTETLGATDRDFGTVLAAWGLGAVIGSAATNVFPRLPFAGLVAAGVALMSLGYIGMGAAAGIGQVVAFSFVGGIGNGLEGLAVVTLVQERTPHILQAQVNGLLESLHTAAPGAGYVLGGAIAALISPRATYWVAGIGALLVLAVAAKPLANTMPSESASPIPDSRGPQRIPTSPSLPILPPAGPSLATTRT
jgi:hypothetical protein